MSRAGDAARAITQAMAAGEEASERLASASGVRAGADQQAAHEKRTIVSDLRAMRERNHLAEMIETSIITSRHRKELRRPESSPKARQGGDNHDAGTTRHGPRQ